LTVFRALGYNRVASYLSSLAASLLLLGLAGCGSPAPITPDRFFSLAPPVLEAPSGTPHPASLQVNDLAARGFLGGRQIIFRTEAAPLQTQRYDQLLWEEPVPRALARHLADAITAARLFEFVLIPADRSHADYILGGEVELFEHHPTSATPRVVGALTLTLVRADDRRSLLQRRYAGEVEVQGATPEAMAEAANRLATLLAAEVVRDLRTWQRGGSKQVP
jgi:cholesterol transport system auxiliary component